MRVKYVGNHFDLDFKQGEIYEAEYELRGMYVIKDADGEAYAYPVSQFEIVPE